MTETSCRIEDCGRPAEIKGVRLCRKHYMRQWRHGDPLAWKKGPRNPLCSVEGCEFRAQAASGMCSKHTARMRRYGSTDLPERPTICAIDGCGRRVVSRALCDRHYRRVIRGKDAERRCRFCGQLIDANAHGRRVFCSDHCAEKDAAVLRREQNRSAVLGRYGLTVEEFDTMFAAQNERCAICQGTEPRGSNWSVDHDHDTGKVRGILCTDCNVGLGRFRDSESLLLTAIGYLKQH